MPVLLDIGDNEQERGALQFDSMGDFLAQWTNLSLGVRDEGVTFGTRKSDLRVTRGEAGPAVP